MSRLQAGSRRKLLHNAISLYAVQACTYLLPLITLPYVARVLGPAHWGAMAFAMSIGTILVIAVEYGFNFSGTREVARIAGDRRALRELVAGVLGAKLLISAAALAIVFLARSALSTIAPSPLLLWSSALWGVGQGINMLWYFQGLQRMTWAGALDVGGKVIATLCTFAFVHSPDDGWKVAAAQAVGCSVSHAITVGIAYCEVGFCWPYPRLVGRALRLGWSMFLFKVSESLLTSMDGLVLGYFGSPLSLGLFLAADKIRQIGVQAFWPITQTLFPHQAQTIVSDPARGARVVRKSFLLIGGTSIAFGLIAFAAAPLLLQWVLGSAFLPAASSLRVLALAIPLQAAIGVLAFQWTIPLGLDRQFNYVVLCTGILNLSLAVLLARALGAFGMATAFTAAQVFELCALELVLRRNKLSAFTRQKPEASAFEEAVLPRAA